MDITSVYQLDLVSTAVKAAVDFMVVAHEGQFRKDGITPYSVHPIGVADLVMSRTSDVDLIVAALLHDVIEDCEGHDAARIEKSFGAQVAAYVVELTNTSKLDYPDKNRAERKVIDNIRLSNVSNWAKLIKLCDIDYNIHDLKSLTYPFIRKFLTEKHAQITSITQSTNNSDLIHYGNQLCDYITDKLLVNRGY